MTGKDILVKSVKSIQGLDRKFAEMSRPKESVLALELLAGGAPYPEIMEKTGLGWDALAGLKARHEQALEVRRKQLADDGFELAEKFRALINKKMEELWNDPEQLKKANIKDFTIPWAIAQDKAFTALGENRTVVEHKGGMTIEDAQKMIEDARRVLQKEAIDVEATNEE